MPNILYVFFIHCHWKRSNAHFPFFFGQTILHHFLAFVLLTGDKVTKFRNNTVLQINQLTYGTTNLGLQRTPCDGNGGLAICNIKTPALAFEERDLNHIFFT